MYQKEIIYMGLYKDGNRMGSAGFLKVENRGRESRLYLKIQNIPLGISGRFPIRVYNGNDWKEINGVTVQDGGGNWQESLTGNVNKTMIQIMLSGGYLLEGKSKSAAESQNITEAWKTTGSVSNENPRGNTERRAQDMTELWKDAEPVNREDLRENAKPQNMSGPWKEMELMNRETLRENTDPQNMSKRWEDTEPVNREDSRENTESQGTAEWWKDKEPKNREYSRKNTKSQDITELGKDMETVSRENPRGNVEQQNRIEQQKTMDSIGRQNLKENTEPQNYEMTRRAQEASPQIIVTEELPRHTSGNTDTLPENIAVYPLKEDKWEQILDTYEKIHPYGDERVYVKLEPKDFVILQSKYQHLVNNSFLLHGFYNYRYVILGKEQDYYLGVPGVFYEREKMVAIMFGFEAFECAGGNARAGEFGYYLKKVEL